MPPPGLFEPGLPSWPYETLWPQKCSMALQSEMKNPSHLAIDETVVLLTLSLHHY